MLAFTFHTKMNVNNSSICFQYDLFRELLVRILMLNDVLQL